MIKNSENLLFNIIIIMRKLLVVLFFFQLLVSCGVKQADYDTALLKCDSLENELDILNNTLGSLNSEIEALSDSLIILSYPAEHRYNNIVQQIENDSLDIALAEINSLKDVFPHSKEAKDSDKQKSIIENRKAKIKAEEERRMALGFKVFKDNSAIEINKDMDLIKCSFSGFTFGKTFTFDYINDLSEYHYLTADKNNTYVLASMSMTTKAKHVSTPTIYVCVIEDGKLKTLRFFQEKYASWSTYGAYIGNYSENSHDFSKVNTVRYKIAAEISLEDAKRPLVIVARKDGDHSMNDCKTVEEVHEKCHVIKIINRNKI